MKAMLVKEGRIVLSEVADPLPKADEILIEIHAAALNRADLLQKKGTYPSPAGWPQWPGLECAGKVLALGDIAASRTSFRVGDSVLALVGGGAYAQKIAVPYKLVLPVPEGLTMAQAASLPEAYTTSYLNLFREGHLKAGQTVYIAAGASGLASAAIPMAKGAGAYVVTDVLSAELAEKIAPLGADYIIDLSKEKVSDVFRRLDEAGTPVNCAMDCLGGADMGEALRYMAEGGYWVLISTLAGVTTQLSLRPLLTRGLHITGSMLRKRSVREKSALLVALQREIWGKIESGAIRPSVYKIFPFEDAEKAQEVLERGENIGKVVLSMRE